MGIVKITRATQFKTQLFHKMPLPDSRRINGPESSHDYRTYIKSKSNSLQNDIISHSRQDGRSKDEHRLIFLKTGVISQARGSAYVEQGKTKVMCGVYGPREIPRRSDFSMNGVLSCSFSRAPFASPKRQAPGSNTDDSEEKEMAIALKEALEATVCMHLYPKSQIDIFITVLENDGSVLASSITCAGLALINASIHVFDVIIGSSMKRHGDVRLTDPSLQEEEESDLRDKNESNDSSCLTVGYLPSSEQISCLLQEGLSSPEILLSDISHLKTVSSGLLPNVTKCLVDSVKSSERIKGKS